MLQLLPLRQLQPRPPQDWRPEVLQSSNSAPRIKGQCAGVSPDLKKDIFYLSKTLPVFHLQNCSCTSQQNKNSAYSVINVPLCTCNFYLQLAHFPKKRILLAEFDSFQFNDVNQNSSNKGPDYLGENLYKFSTFQKKLLETTILKLPFCPFEIKIVGNNNIQITFLSTRNSIVVKLQYSNYLFVHSKKRYCCQTAIFKLPFCPFEIDCWQPPQPPFS